MFDESKHPRDERGRFTDGTSRRYAQNMSYAEIMRDDRESAYVPLDYFGSKKPVPEFDEKKVKAECPKDAYGFANRERLYTQHHQDHANEMGYKNQPAYEVGAINFWKNGVGKVYYDPCNDIYYKYNRKSTEFVAIDKNGVIHTYMQLPNNKMSRKEKQFNLYEIDMSDM